MNLQRRDHKIETGFIVLLFALFFTAVVAALLLAISFYRKIVILGNENDKMRGTTAYIREIIHQNDSYDGISISKYYGLPCIRIVQEEGYLMYLYVEGGQLRQLYLKESAQVDVKDGQGILDLNAIKFKEISPDLLKIECTDALGQQTETFIARKSRKEKLHE